MDRALKVPLSPNEEIALRRVGNGTAESIETPARHIARLMKLALVERQGIGFALTEAGRRRLAAAAKPGSPVQQPMTRTGRRPTGPTAS